MHALRPAARLLCCLLIGLSPVASARAGGFDKTWPDTLQSIESAFPAAQHITPAALADAMAAGDTNTLLLDIRTPAEYRVSHLRGAVPAADTKGALSALRGYDKAQPIVVYCSVGWRSSAAAEALQRAGYRNVRNLKGGIFTWANEDRPLYRGQRRVSTVHPFNRDWGRLLAPRYRSQAR
jgi:rhodanese-related sulfurtransferase